MKFIFDGGRNKKSENSVKNNIITRYGDFLLENLKNGKSLLVVTNAKPVDYYKDRITLFLDAGAEYIDRNMSINIDWNKYDIIFTLGGNPKILFDELDRLDFKIENLKKTVCYIGSSAGTQIMASFFYDYDREEKNIEFCRGFLPESNTIYLVHSDNPQYADEYLKTSVQKFAEENELRIISLKENEVIEK